MYQRILPLQALLKTRSYFLFGPRATGKSTLVAEELPQAHVYDLLDGQTFQRLLRQPSLIAEETSADTLVVIDEVQKLPSVLDEVHRLISKRNQRFLLTGSSARKLRRGAANLLAGRAFQAELLPLTTREIPQFDLLAYLNTTGLPEFCSNDLAGEFLHAYVGTYLKEEIQAESLVRNLPGFTRFLEVVALTNGQELNKAGIASETGVAVRTLEGYFSILDDTLVGFSTPAFRKSVQRKAISRAKYWLFDVGVVNNLCRRGRIEFGSDLFGRAFEHFIGVELRAWLSYTRRRLPLQHWRSTSGYEVDFVVGDELAIEVKGTTHVHDRNLKGIRALKEEGVTRRHIIISCDSNYRKTNDAIEIWPWSMFLEHLWTLPSS